MSLILKCDYCGNMRPDANVWNAVLNHGWSFSKFGPPDTEKTLHYCSKECQFKAQQVPEPPPRRSFSG